MKEFFKPENGMIMECNGKLEVVSSYGCVTNQAENCCDEDHIYNLQIFGKVGLFHRAKINGAVMELLEFNWVQDKKIIQ